MKILFICKSNVARSQMAEAFYKKYFKNPNVKSAGYDPGNWAGKNLDKTKYVKVCMDEEGIDVKKKISKKINKKIVDWSDKIIIFDDHKKDWPAFLRKSNKVEIWKIKDPRGGDLEVHKKVRNKIKDKIRKFVKELTKSAEAKK